MKFFFAFSMLFIVKTFSGTAQVAKKVREIGHLVGEWDIEVEARLSMQGDWENSKATASIRYTLDSALIEEAFSGTRQGKPFLAKTFFAVNNMTNKFQRVFIDAPHGVLVDFEGAQSADSIIFDRTWQYATGATVKLRVVYKILSNDSIVVESMRMPANSNTWDINGRMKYRRVKY